MKLKLISNGTNAGTQLINAETGERIQQISKITYNAGTYDPCSTIVVEFTNLEVDLVEDAIINDITIDDERENTRRSQIEIKSYDNHTASSTRVYDLETTTHEPIGGVQNISLSITPHEHVCAVEKIKI